MTGFQSRECGPYEAEIGFTSRFPRNLFRDRLSSGWRSFFPRKRFLLRFSSSPFPRDISSSSPSPPRLPRKLFRDFFSAIRASPFHSDLLPRNLFRLLLSPPPSSCRPEMAPATSPNSPAVSRFPRKLFLDRLIRSEFYVPLDT